MKPPAITRKDGPLGRFYQIDGKPIPYPSLTHVLSVIAKPALIAWAANQERTFVSDVAADLYDDLHGTPKMSRPTFLTTLKSRLGTAKAHTKELAKAADIGSQTHAIIEWQLRRSLGQKVGPEPKLSDKAMWAYMSWQDWAGSVSLKPLAIEQVVYSDTLKVAGTLDLLAEVNGIRTVIDWKTGKAVYREAFLQNVGYRACLAEMGHEAAQAGLVVRLPKVETDPAFEAVIVEDYNEHYYALRSAVELWRWWYVGEREYQARRAASDAKATELVEV